MQTYLISKLYPKDYLWLTYCLTLYNCATASVFNLDEDLKRVLKVIYKNQKKLLYCQARLASCHSPGRVVTGHVLCKLAVAKGSSPWRNYRSWTNSARLGELLLARARFISMKNPARHDCSPWARCGEFTQNLPCFTKNHILTVLTPTILILSHAITQCI